MRRLVCLFLAGFFSVLSCFAQRPDLPVSVVGEAVSSSIIKKNVSRWWGGSLRWVPEAGPLVYPYVAGPQLQRQIFSSLIVQPVAEKAAAKRAFYLTGFPSLSLFTKIKTDAVIFDLDGTLLDSLGAWENVGAKYVQSRGLEPYEGMTEELVQLSLLDGANLIKERYSLPESAEQILQDTLAPVKKRYQTDIPAKPKVPALLDFLHKQGIKMAVATASDGEFAKMALARLGLLHYFEFVISCDEVGIGKRNPRIYETARQRLRMPKSRTVVVEDALYAIQTAHKAGFPTIGVAEKRAAMDASQIAKTADLFVSFE